MGVTDYYGETIIKETKMFADKQKILLDILKPTQ